MVTAAQRRATKDKRNARRRLQLRKGRAGVLARTPRRRIAVQGDNLKRSLPLSAAFRQSIVAGNVDLLKEPGGAYDAYFLSRRSAPGGPVTPALVLQSTTGPIAPTREMAEDIAADIRQVHGAAADSAVPDSVVMRVAPGSEPGARAAMQHIVDTLNASADPADASPPLIAVERPADATDPNVVAMVFTLQRAPQAGQGAPANPGQPNAAAQAAPAQAPRLARDPADLHSDVPLVEVMTSERFAALTQRRGQRTPEYTRLARALDAYHQGVASFRREADAVRQQILQAGTQRQADAQALDTAELRYRTADADRNAAIAVQFDTLIRLADLNRLLGIAERDPDATEANRLRPLRDAAQAEADALHAKLNNPADDGLSPATIARFQQVSVARRSALAAAATTLNTRISRSHDLMREHQAVLDAQGRHVLADAQSYLDSKTPSTTNARQNAARQLITQLSDPDQHMQRLKAAATEMNGVDFRHGLATATTLLNAVSSSDVFRATTNGPIGQSETRSGFAKRAIVAGEAGNDATVNLGFGTDQAVVGSPNLIARQVVCSRIAHELDVNVLADEVFSKDTDGRTLGITAAADGGYARQAMRRRSEETHIDPVSQQQDTREAVAYAQFDLTRPGVQKGLADLAVVDAITGQQDRNLGNIFIDDQAETVTGIDNDMALNGTGPPHASLPTALDNFNLGPLPAPRSLEFLAPLIDARTAAAVLAMTDDQLEGLVRGRANDPERLGAGEVANAKRRLHAVQDRIRVLALRNPSGLVQTWGPATHARALAEGVSPGVAGGREHSYLARIHLRYAAAATAADPWSTQIP